MIVPILCLRSVFSDSGECLSAVYEYSAIYITRKLTGECPVTHMNLEIRTS